MTTLPKSLLTSKHGRVLTITLDSPPGNFLTSKMMQELQQLLGVIENDSSIGAVIFASALENIFITHFDVDEIEKAIASIPFTMPSSIASMLTRTESAIDQIPGGRQLIRHTIMSGVTDMNLLHEITASMRAMNKVFIAAINGRALGGGCELALACDLRLMAEGEASEGIMIGQPEILIGLTPGGGGTQMLARSLGVAKALEHCLEGKPLTPKDALEIGLINKVIPAEKLMQEAMTTAERLANRSPQAVKIIKHAIYQASSLSWDEGMEAEKNGFLSAVSQPNTRRALKVYIAHIRSLLETGKTLTLDDFSEFLEGTATDLTS